jgi:hypothetical protein
MTVAEAEERFSALELTYWKAFFKIEKAQQKNKKSPNFD